MNAKGLAAKLAGATYENFIIGRDDAILTRELKAEAKKHGLVIVYGASDDLMEFAGAIDDEIGAWAGAEAYVDSKGLLRHRDSIDDDEELKDYFARKPSAKIIEALWCNEPGYSWTFKTDIPHETFEITEDGEPYCRGIVFALADVASKLGPEVPDVPDVEG